LETADARTYGLVLNKVAKRDARPYAYNVGYYAARHSDAAIDSAPQSADDPAARVSTR